MKLRRIYIIFIAAISMAIFCFISCSDDHPTRENNELVSFQLNSRADDDSDDLTSRTFRIVTYNPTKYTLDQTGTFIFQNDENNLGEIILTPYPLSDNGDRDDSSTLSESESIIRKDGEYYLVVVSPGIKCNDDGSFSINLKDLQKDDNKLFLSENIESSDFRYYGSVKLKQKLLDYRSKIGFKFCKSDDADDFYVTDLQIIGAGSMDEAVVLHPQRLQVVTDPESVIDMTLTDIRDNNKTDDEGNKIFYDTGENDLLSIVPGIYAPKDSVYKITGIKTEYLKDTDYITMKCELQQGDRDPAHIHLNLSQSHPTFKPQNKYIYNIVIRSNYIIMTVDVYDDEKFITNGWEFGGDDSCEISNPDRITLGFWKIVQTEDKGWELIELDEQTIE